MVLEPGPVVETVVLLNGLLQFSWKETHQKAAGDGGATRAVLLIWTAHVGTAVQGRYILAFHIFLSYFELCSIPDFWTSYTEG